MNYTVLGQPQDEGIIYYLKNLGCEVIDYYKKGNFVRITIDHGQDTHRIKLKIPKFLRGDRNIDMIVFLIAYIKKNLPHLIV